VNGVGIDAVVARAGVAKASLYSNFAGKDDLIRAVLEEADERDLGRYRAILEAAGPDPRARIDALFEALHALSRQRSFRGCAFVNAGLALPDRDHPAHAVIRRHKSRVRDLLDEQLEDLSLDDRAAVADTLALLVDAALTVGGLRPEEQPALRARDAARAVLAR
jgi:AcrR family transcriptional regulator